MEYGWRIRCKSAWRPESPLRTLGRHELHGVSDCSLVCCYGLRSCTAVGNCETGPSLVKGVVQNPSAVPLSIKQGGSAIMMIQIEGGLEAHHDGVMPLELDGKIERLRIDRGVAAEGR